MSSSHTNLKLVAIACLALVATPLTAATTTPPTLWQKIKRETKETAKIVGTYAAALSVYNTATLAPISDLASGSLVGSIIGCVQGTVLGLTTTAACRIGSWPQVTLGDIAKPLAISLGTAGTTALPCYFTWDRSQSNKSMPPLHFAEICITGAVCNAALIAYIIKMRYALNKQAKADAQTHQNTNKQEADATPADSHHEISTAKKTTDTPTEISEQKSIVVLT